MKLTILISHANSSLFSINKIELILFGARKLVKNLENLLIVG